MTGNDFLRKLNSPEGNMVLEQLYGRDAVEQERRRFSQLAEEMRPESDFPLDSSEGTGNMRIFSAPGRTELGGNHTDHNCGRVLAASIQMDAVAIVIPRSDRKVFYRSTGFPDVQIDLDDEEGKPDLFPKKTELETTDALVRGIAAGFAGRGVSVGGFSANASSTVFRGSGLSSSAAVEVLIAKIFDTLYGGEQCSALELAQISRRAENEFFGKPCGLMDQTASASGGAVAIDFADSAAPKVKNIEFDPLAAGYALCVVNTRGSHSDLTPDYAAIPSEMNEVAGYFGKTFLREVDLTQVISSVAEIRNSANDRALLRALHFFNENRRVDSMAELLEAMGSAADQIQKKEIFTQFLDLVNESGDSSWELLQNIYSPRSPAVQELSVALAVSREFFRAHGMKAACRVHGGGFAGTIQAYIPVEGLDAYRTHMDTIFGAGALTILRIRRAGAVELWKNN